MTYATINEINQSIMFSGLSNEQLNSVMSAVKYARGNLTKQIKNSIWVGDHVQFTNTKTGRDIQGTVYKIAIKYVTVNTGMGLWKVPANMLRHVKEMEAA